MRVLRFAWYRLRMLRGAARVGPARALAVAVGVVAALAAIGHGGEEAAALLTQLEVEPERVRAWLVAGALAIGAGVVLVSLVAQLFDAARVEELERLAVLPVAPPSLFGCLVVDQLPAAAVTLYLTLPVVQLVARQAGLGWAGALGIAVGVALLLLQVVFALLAAAVMLVRLLPSRLLRLRGVLGVMLLAPLPVGLAVAAFEGRVGQLASGLPQVAWIDELVLGLGGRSELLWRAAMSLAAATLALAVLAEWVCARWLIPDVAVLADKLRPGGPATGRGRVLGRLSLDGEGMQLAGLVRREMLSALRDRGMLLAWAMGGVIAALPAVALLALPAERRLAYASLYWMGVGWAGFNALALPGLAAFAREGEQLGPLAWLPVPLRRVLAARVAFHVGPMVVWAGCWAGVLCGLTGASLPLVWACAMVFGVGMAAIAAPVGAVFVRWRAGAAFRGVAPLGVAVFAMLQMLLLATAGALGLASMHLGRVALVAWGAAIVVWVGVGLVLRDEAIRALERARSGVSP